MYLSLGQAAKETGKSKSVIANALHSGRLSGKKTDKGGWEIDPAELFRVFAKQNTKERKKEQIETHENPTQNLFLEQEIRHLQKQLDRERELNRDLSRRLDVENEERRKLTLLLTDQRATAPQKATEGRLIRTWLRF